MNWFRRLRGLRTSIGVNIILPYLILTSIVGGAGVYVVTNLVASSLQERFDNQLLDAGRIVADGMVGYEEIRLQALRMVVGTEGVAEALAVGDREVLAGLVPQIIGNSKTDAVELIDIESHEVFGWQKPLAPGLEGEERSGADYSDFEGVMEILNAMEDSGPDDKRVIVSETPYGIMLFTVGPVELDGELVGAAMVGTYIHKMLVELTEQAVARVTLYEKSGQVLDSTLASATETLFQLLKESPEQYTIVMAEIEETPNRYPIVARRAEDEVFLRRVQVLGQEYALAFGDWRVRGESYGLFSVALPSNFISDVASNNRNQFSLIFALATIAVFVVGYFVAQRIINPLNKLVQTARSVAQGNLQQRTQISRTDEIGTLARSFDVMTENLDERNRQLVAQASELETILNSIADGVIVLDMQGEVITTNPAAGRILTDMSDEQKQEMLQEFPGTLPANGSETSATASTTEYLSPEVLVHSPSRYRVGNRVFSALAAPMRTPQGEHLGTVIALRDITREAEAEYLQDGFITSISHELRTPLTAVKGYSDLLLKMPDTSFSPRHITFLETINANADRLVFHINKLIDISEIQAGTLELDEQPVCFTALVKDVSESWRERIEERNLTLDVNILPKDIYIQGDKNRLHWAIDNYLSNAFNYTPNGGIVVDVSLSGDEICLDVSDTGVGIIAADQPYLFNRFFRANNNNEFTFNVDGVGLGLFITRAIVDLHGGRTWMNSKVGQGSVFSMAMPVAKD